MTTNEFSTEFDTLIGAYLSTLPSNIPGTILEFDEYEKSVFLTQAQEALVINYYTSSTVGDSFETSEETRRYLDSLVVTDYPEGIIFPEGAVPTLIEDQFVHSIYELKKDVWFIVYEQASYGNTGGACIAGFTAEVVPVTHDSYYRTKENPFRGPSRKRVLRLDSGSNTVELVSKYPIGTYEIRYLKQPNPIILEDLEDLKINGVSKKSECILNPSLHRRILEMAVQLAIASRIKKKS